MKTSYFDRIIEREGNYFNKPVKTRLTHDNNSPEQLANLSSDVITYDLPKAQQEYKEALADHEARYDNFMNCDSKFHDLCVHELNVAALRVANAKARLELIMSIGRGEQ